MSDLWSDLLVCLDLQPAANDVAGAPKGFEGRNQRLAYHRVFGGQLLGQFVRAARLTCPDKEVKSVHALFPREGRSDEPIHYEVECQHEGRSFATLAIVARQDKGVAATASVSMHAVEEGLGRQTVPALPAVPGAEHEVEFDLLPWETRSTADLDSRAAARPELDLWMRTPQVNPELAPALAAYATDLNLI